MMGAPQIIYIALSSLGLGIIAAKHGEPREDYNFWVSLFGEVIIIALLAWGGFFKGV